MKVTFPHMGTMWVPVKTLLEELGMDVVIPPPSTKRTLSLGTRFAPEFICMPLKINLGNFIEAAEKGADTIVMAGGVGPCRFGYYSRLEKEILDDLGYSMEMIIIEPPEKHFIELVHKLGKLKKCSPLKALSAVRLGWLKCCVADNIEKKVEKVRAREKNPGSADTVFNRALEKLDYVRTRKDVLDVQKEVLEELDSLVSETSRQIIRIAVVGEIYTVLEPFVNHNLERHLGRMGAETHRSLYLSSWVNDHILNGFFDIEGTEEACKLASPYLNHMVGGHGRETVGSTVLYARQGFDGVIQIAPLTCGPEIVAEAILPEVSQRERIPIMTIYVDEQSGEAGLLTRLEAFVDMIYRSKQNSKKLTAVKGL